MKFSGTDPSRRTGTGPMQDWLPASLTTATTFKSQKILFKARALGSNLLQPKGDYVHLTSQYYSASIETRPPQLHNLLCFSALPSSHH